jgi:hypothetical protein
VETPTGLTVYTDEMLAEAVRESQVRAHDEVKRVFAENTLEVLREEVRSGDLTTDYATDLHNKLASAIGFDEVSSVQNTYSVMVSYNGEEIATFTGIEADDEDDAVDKVNSDLEVEEVEISITIGFNGNSESATVSGDTYRTLEKLELTAEVED